MGQSIIVTAIKVLLLLLSSEYEKFDVWTGPNTDINFSIVIPVLVPYPCLYLRWLDPVFFWVHLPSLNLLDFNKFIFIVKPLYTKTAQ